MFKSRIKLSTTLWTLLVLQILSSAAYILEERNFKLRIGDSVVTSKKSPKVTAKVTSKVTPKATPMESNSISSLLLTEKATTPNQVDEMVNPLECNLDENVLREIRSYKDVVKEIVDYVTVGEFKGKTYDMLAELTDTFGPRMTGTKQLEDSINWMMRKFSEQRLENIHAEPVWAPHWVRNNESLYLLHPRVQKLSLLGLGSSIGTPAGGITAEVLVVKSFEELDTKANKAKGSIVVFNPEWTSYGQIVPFRVHAASRAAKVGAVATLVRSTTPFSINSPHTGWQHYEDPSNKLPTACITVEDAHMLQRLQDGGKKIIIHLSMGAENLPPVLSRNTVAEVIGYEKPEEVVVVSAHLDSWDIGVGAMDDGGGSIISWGATTVLKQLSLRARRTVRTVLFTGEEQGLYGGQDDIKSLFERKVHDLYCTIQRMKLQAVRAYFDRHSKNKEKFQLILESDVGTFDPKGLSFSGNNYSQCLMKEIVSLLEPINTTKLVSPMSGGPDIQSWEEAGVPTGSLLNDDNERYFWFHHSEGDTMDVENAAALDKCTALWTAVAYVAADLNFTLPHFFSDT